MIHYELRCGDGHEFDGWFRDSANFEQQAARGLIGCPSCADTRIVRALMAPSLSRARKGPVIDAATADTPVGTGVAAVPDKMMSPAMPLPDEVRVFLQRMRAEVEKTCTYVGSDFAGEARRMHKGAVPAAPIYGEATPDEAEALRDDGIDVARIPWVPRADS